MRMPQHWPTYLAVLTVAVVIILSIRPVGAKNYGYAIVDSEFRSSRSHGFNRTHFRTTLNDQSVSMRAASIRDRVSVGDIICVTYTDNWPEGLVIRQQVSLARCQEAGAIRPEAGD